MKTDPRLTAITQRIIDRSADTRADYLTRMEAQRARGPLRGGLSCSNLAHGFAACSADDKQALTLLEAANIGIVNAYNDMLSAHQPLENYPALIKEAAHSMGCTAQVAGGVPAMCDGVTQGTPGMELSLFSRDIIAGATAIALSHNMFDGVLCLGVCDKIVPGLLIGALSFGHLPVIFAPAGPMSSGLSNKEKAAVRQQFAEGKVGRDKLLEAESAAYHGEGTCTFYGTANSNQMLMEVMGIHIPGAAFEPPGTALRDELTRGAAERLCRITALGRDYTPLASIVDEKCLVNAIVALLATGGSTNHSIHWIAIARAAGVIIDWQDFSDLSAITPLVARVYPNGSADVNHFHAAGGSAYVIRTLLDNGLLHEDVNTNWGEGLRHYTREPRLIDQALKHVDGVTVSGDPEVLRPADTPFDAEGGLRLLTGNLGRCVIKTSAVAAEHQVVQAPARVFEDQHQLQQAFDNGELEQDVIVVVRFQGPSANGMPELHKLTPYLGILQDRGHKVALVTDGRMSGASGKVPAAIHLTPEALTDGPIGKIQDGDMLRLDAIAGTLSCLVPQEEWAERGQAKLSSREADHGTGRELFGHMRLAVNEAELGATVFKI
ncbi:phosphogluconate dehydratase [Pseudohalioglobus lutimaris]|uniref:Phosphogluconate dehydratase n=1 Tax=Pseudohalioglobus lutimaris TaxID=1737061 RepID=A0A2N5X599_9GAMM|nr:phosphogluconate dehydratase [Pseudohalioglobus lutimaris]PLW69663.1 phosphogluconate dehydratase [Pseudohalioglobus lutimaris]